MDQVRAHLLQNPVSQRGPPDASGSLQDKIPTSYYHSLASEIHSLLSLGAEVLLGFSPPGATFAFVAPHP